MPATLQKLAMNWWTDLKGKVRHRELLKHHTTFRIGGSAKYFIEPKDVDDLKLLLHLLKRYKINFLVIGEGSNILASDKGVDGVVLRLSSPDFKKIIIRENRVEVGAGYLLNKLISQAKKHGLSGPEFLVGIPATVGGALMMNAGAWGKSIADLVEKVNVMDYNSKIRTLNKKKIRFGYRRSGLEKYIILSVHLKLKKENKALIQNRIKEYFHKRLAAQDLSRPSAGCIFKNPAGDSAGRLIDLCGLKGKKIGSAFVSCKHANFILNLGKARTRDVLKLMALIKKEVKKKFNVTLKPEIKLWL